ncbi:hypothetical protein OG713_46050 (plasmid) [Streptomyces sp. NBC_00723]|uniref:hypothetical protein n=1 Tax=Streptomyces sp. NBC_00723 TaxID=2903673 RepID=UPI002F91316D
MPQELTTQVQLDAFAAEVARELGTHCRTAELTDFGRGLGRLIIDGDGHALRLCQPDDRHPGRLRIYAALPDENKTPSIGVTASTARHVAREIARRLYPLHAEVAQQAARQQAEEIGRRAVAEALAGALPGARIEEQFRRTRIIWQHATRPPGQRGPVQVEVSGRPSPVISMLAAFAQASQE